MVVMGLVMTLKWDSLFPDRRDYLILSPLPISQRRMFAAKVCALVAFLLLFSVAINFFSMITVPFLYTRGPAPLSRMFDAFEAHAGAVLGASCLPHCSPRSGRADQHSVITAFAESRPNSDGVDPLLVIVFLTLPYSGKHRPLSERDGPKSAGCFPFIWFLGFTNRFFPARR
jgi:hypothetical protein